MTGALKPGNRKGMKEICAADDHEMIFLGFQNLFCASEPRKNDETGTALIQRLMRHRFVTQLVGVVAIFFTAMFGMYKNLYVGPIAF